METSSILYVEDEEDYQLLVQRILGKVGLTVDIAQTGEEGMERLQRQRPSLLILDINLPDANGYDLCSQLRKNPDFDDLPILMLTVRRRPDEWLRGFSSGADDYVSKPLNPPELVERVRTCLEGRRVTATLSDNAEYLLIQASVAGNRAAFEVLIQKYRERLICSLQASGKLPSDAEDIASLAFLRAFQRLHQFLGQSSFYTWLYRIALNEADHLQRQKPNISLETLTRGDEAILPVAFAEQDRVADALDERVLKSQMDEAIDRIPKPYRQILRGHFLRGISYEALAKQLKIPPGTVSSRLSKAKELLRLAWKRKTLPSSLS